MSGIRSVTNSELVSCTMPPLVGGEDSTVVGIIQRSPANGDRVGDHVQGGCVCVVSVSARLLLNSWTSLPCLHASVTTVHIRSHGNCGQ